jgi:hypothetical protein
VLRLLAETLLAETRVEGAAREPARAADRVSVSVDALTAAPLQQLLQTIEERLFPASTTLADVSSPRAAEAKETALKSVDQAAQAIEHGAIHNPHIGHRIPENLDPQTVLALATRMIETQQYPNYLRATELSNTIVAWYEGPLPGVAAGRSTTIQPPELEPRDEVRLRSAAAKWTHSVTTAWRRAPLLVLLTGWLLIGIAGALLLRIAGGAAGSSPLFTLWALGFPALIVLQFALTVRGAWLNKPVNKPLKKQRGRRRW